MKRVSRSLWFAAAGVLAIAALNLGVLVGEAGDKFVVVLLARLSRLLCLVQPLKFEKSGDLSHIALHMKVAPGRGVVWRRRCRPPG